MTLEQLLDNHRRASINAALSASTADRATYFDLVGYYARRIAAKRRAEGLPEMELPPGPEHDV